MTESFIILVHIISALFTAAVSACFVAFWDFCTGEPDIDGNYKQGRIFSFIGKWLSIRGQVWEIGNEGKLNPYKAMGLCPLCFGVYVSFAFAAAASILIGLPWWYFLPVAVITMRLVRAWV